MESGLPDEPTIQLSGLLLDTVIVAKAPVRRLTDDEMASTLNQLKAWSQGDTLVQVFIATPFIETALRGKVKIHAESFVAIEQNKECFHTFDLKECSAGKVEKVGNSTMLRLGGPIGNFGITILDENVPPEKVFGKYPFLTKTVQ